MNTTCIIPRSTIEKRYDKAREDFNDQYDNSPYKLKCKEFYLGGGVENYEVANKILSMNEKEIANLPRRLRPERLAEHSSIPGRPHVRCHGHLQNRYRYGKSRYSETKNHTGRGRKFS